MLNLIDCKIKGSPLGIAREAFWLLSKFSAENKVRNASVLQLGKQSGIVTLRDMRKVARFWGLVEPTVSPRDKSDVYWRQPIDQDIFSSIGYTKIDSIDVSDYEDSTLAHDLNVPLVAGQFEQYDLIFDGGTSEHIFDQIQVLKNIHILTKIGGFVIHYTPANNFVDHGFYQFSPSYYHDYYSANNYKIHEFLLLRSDKSFKSPRYAYKYVPLAFEHLSYGGWGDYMLGNWVVVEKTAESTSGLNPQQTRYKDLLWVGKQPDVSSKREYSRLRKFVVGYLRAHPKFRQILLQFLHDARGFLPKNKRAPKMPRPIYKI